MVAGGQFLDATCEKFTWETVDMPGKVFEIPKDPLPDMCPPAITFFEGLLSPTLEVFEFGSGRSTLWLAKRVEHLISLEHNPSWYGEVKRALERDKVTNVDARYQLLIYAKENYQNSIDWAATICEYPDESFDIVSVDGYDDTRIPAIEFSMPKVKAGGWMVVDDSHWKKLEPGLRLLETWERVDVPGQKPHRTFGATKDTQTSFFRKP